MIAFQEIDRVAVVGARHAEHWRFLVALENWSEGLYAAHAPPPVRTPLQRL
jgi:hypothetical protein